MMSDALANHRHDYHEVMWFAQGRGQILTGLDCCPVKPDMMCFLSPGQLHAWNALAGGLGGFVLGFTHRFFSGSAEDANALIQLPCSYGVGASQYHPEILGDQTLDERRRDRQLTHLEGCVLEHSPRQLTTRQQSLSIVKQGD